MITRDQKSIWLSDRRGRRFLISASDLWVIFSADNFKVRRDGYVEAYLPDGDRVLLHRLISGLKRGDKRQVDHANHLGFDCRRSNLRVVTFGQNVHHQNGLRKNNTSGYRGVFSDPSGWLVKIMVDRKIKYVGRFKSKREAARAYDAFAVKFHERFATLNFPGGRR